MNLLIIYQLTKCPMILTITIAAMILFLFFDHNSDILYIHLFTFTSYKAKRLLHQFLYQYTNANPVNNNDSAMY